MVATGNYKQFVDLCYLNWDGEGGRERFITGQNKDHKNFCRN